ncbi:MAG: helix-turn-helix domain-containing protein [Gordonia sp. (in: high G+C Gram-positive bacteria)]|uniref:sigma-54-dependent Fis family transcriptional regulator n=1 Tax=Gordonia sp. (in: high G+C Gram-positive bacteria) TaxID=84139 RepID=UPI0039E5B5C0
MSTRTLSSDQQTPGLPRYITQSWHRSREAGLVPDREITQFEYVADLDFQRRLVQCASPVLDRLRHDLADMPLSIALTDEHARVMLRRDSDRRLAGLLDSACFAPGFDYSEGRVGTNGVGTAVESGMPVYIDGAQHFNEGIREFTCAGAPVHDPLSGRLEGIIDISCLARYANPMMRQLVVGAARDIEAELRSLGSAKQRAVLAAFIAACRRRASAVFSLSCGVFMSNSGDHRILDPVDEAFLREEAQSMLAPSTLDRFTLNLPSGQAVEVRRTLIEEHGESAGVVLEVEPVTAGAMPAAPSTQRAPALPGAVGTSPQWARCRTELADLAAASTNTLLTGETGAGRTTLARGAHLNKNPQAPYTVVDCAASTVVTDVEEALGSGATTVILRRIDALAAPDDALIAEMIADDQHGYPARWIVATADAGNSALLDSRLVPLLERTVEIPALRHHPDDVLPIARMHLGQLAPHRTVTLDDGLVRALKKYPWPGNVTELVDALTHALRANLAGTLTEHDLPPSIHSAPKRTMTALETAERDTIVAALRENGGNRARAARMLGIARSSLYRKIDTYGITL